MPGGPRATASRSRHTAGCPSDVVERGFVALDEAAAATAVMVGAMCVPTTPPRALVVDRPFRYVIHDVPTRTPLFVGRVLDPTD
jgi:serpin B